jgi:putative FmdB family regulatory protein
MPIYEYRCTSCGHEKEVLQKMSDAPLKECPACGKATLSKLISAAGFQLKGSGWYATDFKGGSKAAKPSEDKGESKSTDETKSGDGGKAKSESNASGERKPKEEPKSAAAGGASSAPAAR